MVLDFEARFETGGGIRAMNTRRMALDYIKIKPASELFDKDDAESAIPQEKYLMHESYLLR